MKKESWKEDASIFPLQRLIDIQEKHHYLPEKELKALAEELKIPLVKIYETATFYSFLNLKPKGKNIIRICKSPSCHLNGSENVVKIFEGLLKIKMDETTKDKKFTLEFTSCIGCCNQAPAAVINDKLYTSLDKKKIGEIIKNLK
ncbi:MAG: NAD(P)H-dependent oxidoreductase subunit E [Candidatus Woesearchaeota archaeon]